MQIKSAADFGETVRSERKRQRMTQSELAGATGVGVRFLVDLENGKPTCELEKSLLVALMLGIKLTAKAPEQNNE